MLDRTSDNLDQKDALADCLEILQHSQTGQELYREAKQNAWNIDFCLFEKHDFHMDVPSKTLLLNSNDIGNEALLLNLIRALRDIWQEKRHGAFEDQYKLEDVLMLERVRHADCETVTVQVAWELKSFGYETIWQALLNADTADMARSFENAIDRHPSWYFNGKALSATFARWYADEDRVNECDHATLEYMDMIVDDLGHNANAQKLTPVGIEVLSCMPDRTAYLQGQGYEILSNPDYAGLHDPINQSHFFHIVHDSKVVMVNDVPFRDINLARKIFPEDRIFS